MRFSRDESGSATVELVIWLPFLIGFVLFVFELTMYMFQTNQVHDISRNVTRQVAVGFWTPIEAQNEVLAMFPEDLNPNVDILLDSNGVVRYSLTVAPRISITGIFSILDLSEITIDYFMRSEVPLNEEEGT